MNPFGSIYPQTISFDPLNIPFMPFLGKEITFRGTCSARPIDVERMLDFAATHGIKPIVEKFPMTEDGIAAQ